MKFVSVKIDFGEEFILATACLYRGKDQLTLHTVYYNGQFSQVQLYCRYTLYPIKLNKTLSNEVYSQARKHLSNLVPPDRLKQFSKALTKNHFLPDKWFSPTTPEQERKK